MTFFEFLESRHVTKSLELQLQFSPYVQSETLAIKSLIDVQRKFYKTVNFFKTVVMFWGMKLGVVPQPRSANDIILEFNANAEKQKAQLVEAQAQAKSTDNVMQLNKPLKV